MKYLSVCSGIEAASVAFRPLGWEPLAFSEIEPFPRAVLQHHHPDVPLHGDFTELKEQPWIVDADVLCGGTPCQAFSVAGLRNSLSDDRGNLTLQFIHLADAIDALRSTAGRQPAWILWENVPGVLSTKDNAFGAFLGGLCGRDAAIPEPQDGWSGSGVVDGPQRVAAWRTLDAQFFGLAQRRKRVFVLALGGAGKWACADALLPITESLRGDTAPRREKRQGVAAATGEGASGGGGLGTEGGLIPEVTRPLTAAMGTKWNGNGDLESSPIPSKWPADLAPTLNASFGDKQGLEDQHALNGAGLFVPVFATDGQANAAFCEDKALALNATNEQPYIAAPIVFDPAQVTSKTNRSNPQHGDPVHTLHQGEPPMLAYAIQERAESENPDAGPQGKGWQEDSAFTMEARHRPQSVSVNMQVRRLTPEECEALQGFPREHTNIPWRGKPESPDGNRYKALGNSWAVPVVAWIGRRIELVRSRQ